MRQRRGFTIIRHDPEARLHCSVAAAVVGAAVVGGVATSMAGKKAADSQTNSAKNATAEQRRQFDLNRADLAPFREAGYTSLGQISEGLKDGGDFNRDFTTADFQKDPGYQFRMDEGTQALERSAAARGGLLNGGTLKALDRYGQDYASGEYSNAYSRFNNDRTTRFNRLASVAGVGQTAVNTGVANGTNTANNISDIQLQAGNARAANAINTGNAISNTASTLGNFYLSRQYQPPPPATASQAGPTWI